MGAVHAHIGDVKAPVLHLLGRQFMVASIHQLDQLGMSVHAVARARRSGQFEELLPGVVRLGGAPDTFESKAMVLLLAADPVGMLPDVTSAQVWGVTSLPRAKVQIATPIGTRIRVPGWAQSIQSRWPDTDCVHRSDGLVVASPERTLFMLGAGMGETWFSHVAEQMWLRNLVTPDGLRVWLQANRGRGRTGVTRMERWLESIEGRTRPQASRLEMKLIDACVALGLPEPRPQHELRIDGGRRRIFLDGAWLDVRLGIEPGHRLFHFGDAARRDHDRDLQCDEIGWRVLRFDEIQLRDLWGCARQVKRIYDNRRATLRSVEIS